MLFTLVGVWLSNLALSVNERPVKPFLRGYTWTYDRPNMNYGDTHLIPFWTILRCFMLARLGIGKLQTFKGQWNFLYAKRMLMFQMVVDRN